MIWKDPAFRHIWIVILRSQRTRGAKIHQNAVLRLDDFQSIAGRLVFSFPISLQLKLDDLLDHSPKTLDHEAELVMQKALQRGGLRPARHHDVTNAGKQGMGEMCSQNPF